MLCVGDKFKQHQKNNSKHKHKQHVIFVKYFPDEIILSLFLFFSQFTFYFFRRFTTYVLMMSALKCRFTFNAVS
jgi:hypothetical protein